MGCTENYRVIALHVGGGEHRPRRAAPVGVPPTDDNLGASVLFITGNFQSLIGKKNFVMQSANSYQKLHQYVGNGDEKLLKLLYAPAKEYNDEDVLNTNSVCTNWRGLIFLEQNLLVKKARPVIGKKQKE